MSVLVSSLSTALITYSHIRIFLCYTLLGNALLINLDVESMKNVHLSHRNVSLLSTARFPASVQMFLELPLTQLWDNIQACHMVFCHGGSHLGSTILEVAIFGTWAAYQDAAWQLLHLGNSITPKFQTPNTHKCSKLSTSK